MEILGWIFLGILALIVLAVIGVMLASVSDIRRYKRIRDM